jgi:hypothetical protein
LVELIGSVTTLEQAKAWNQKGKFTIEANGEFLDDYIEGGGTDEDLEGLRYEVYGCLSCIYVRFDNGIVDSILFDVWSNACDTDFIENININDLTKANYQYWLNSYSDTQEERM